MKQEFSRAYVGKAWRSLATTKNLFGKLLLLALLQLVPILGPIVAMAYFLGWAREAAWGMETPLPAHVFGRDDRDFWARGAKAFAVNILYGLIAVVLTGVLLVPYTLVVESNALDANALFILDVVFSALTLLLILLLCGLQVVGLLRLAIYNRFGCAFQWGVCIKMLFHELGGLIKIGLAYMLIYLLVSIPMVAAVLTVFPALFATVSLGAFGAALYGGGVAQSVYEAFVNGFLSCSALTSGAWFVMSLLISAAAFLLEAAMWRSLGNWAARFDVASWGGRFDPLPYQRPAVAADEAAEEAAAPAEPAPKKRCHPVLQLIVMLILSALIGLGASFFSVSTLSVAIEEGDLSADFETYVEEVVEGLSAEFEGALELEGLVQIDEFSLNRLDVKLA